MSMSNIKTHRRLTDKDVEIKHHNISVLGIDIVEFILYIILMLVSAWMLAIDTKILFL